MDHFSELAKNRYSVRSYAPTPVEDEKITEILEAGRIAPTARNFQPQKIYVVRSEAMKKKIAEVTPCSFNAPVIFVICYDETRASVSKLYPGHNFGNTDAAIVCTHMMFRATELGLGSCWVGWFNENEVREALNIPEHIRVCELLPVGYAAADAKPSLMHKTYRPAEETIEYI